MHITTDEERDFGASVRQLLESRDVVAATRTHADDATSWNSDVWSELVQMGVADLATEGEFGALIEVADALGRYPATVPALSGAVLVPVLLSALGLHAEGVDVVQAPAIGPFDAHGRLVVGDVDVADVGSAQVTVTGRIPLALGSLWASQLITLARHADGIAVVLVPLDGADISPRASLDATIPFADIDLDARGRTLGVVSETAADDALARMHAVAALWLSASEVGTAQRLLDLAVAYAADRVQFGMPIGQRQAIKHRCADMLIQVESARSAVCATASLDPSAAGWAEAAALMRLATDRAVDMVAQSSFQIHGGIGFTWEHDLHLLFKRALVSRSLLGGAAHHRSTLTSLLREHA